MTRASEVAKAAEQLLKANHRVRMQLVREAARRLEVVLGLQEKVDAALMKYEEAWGACEAEGGWSKPELGELRLVAPSALRPRAAKTATSPPSRRIKPASPSAGGEAASTGTGEADWR